MLYATRKNALNVAARRSGLVGVLILTGGCATTMAGGIDAGCASYSEARLSLPVPLDTSTLAHWVADLDDRMTGACTDV